MTHSAPPDSGSTDASRTSLSQSDSEMARVLEDLVDVLITRGVIQFTDLPEAAQAKLLERRQNRVALHQRLNLLPDDDHDLI